MTTSMLDSKLINYSKKPIEFQYSVCDKKIASYRQGNTPVIISETERIKTENVYYYQKIPGTKPYMMAREIVDKQIQKVVDSLPLNSYLKILDAFRSIETQKNLFFVTCSNIKKLHPELNEEEIIFEAKKFCAHPNEPSRFDVPPHNSGGSVDLAIYDTALNETWDFGTEFDDNTELSETAFFEREFSLEYGIGDSRWNEIRKNRRILFYIMKEYGFVNYHGEWWHYSLGDCIWANVLGTQWIFGSMENNYTLDEKVFEF